MNNCRPSCSDCSNSPPVPRPSARFQPPGIELGVVSKDTVLVERDPAVRGEIRGDARPGRNPVVQFDNPPMFRFEARHRARKGVAQTRHYLKERQIRIGQLRTDEMGRPGGMLQHPFEIAEVFWRPRFHKVGGAGTRFLALIFVIEATGYWMVGVVNLVHKIGDRELQLVGPQPARLVRRRQAVMSAEIEQNVGGLADDQLLRLQEGRRERQMLDALAAEQAHHRSLATGLPRNVYVFGPRFLQRQSDELAAPLDAGPIIELISHAAAAPPAVSEVYRPANSASRRLTGCSVNRRKYD